MDGSVAELGEFLPSVREFTGSTLEPYKPGRWCTYCLGTQRVEEEEEEETSRRRKEKERGTRTGRRRRRRKEKVKRRR